MRLQAGRTLRALLRVPVDNSVKNVRRKRSKRRWIKLLIGDAIHLTKLNPLKINRLVREFND
jgi:hypothetical protein